MDNSSFNYVNESVIKTIKSPNQAYFGRFSNVNSYLCEVNNGRVHVKKPVEKTGGLNRWLVKINQWLEKN